MSVTIRRYRRGGWEADIRLEKPDGSIWRERKRAPVRSESAAMRWAEARERYVLTHGFPEDKPTELIKEVPTLEAFFPRFIEGYARANRQKPSGIEAKESIGRVHLVPQLGTLQLDAINTERVQRLKLHLQDRSAKTTNNVLTRANRMATWCCS